jgi:hypothetical protein
MNCESKLFPAQDRSPFGPNKGAAILYGAWTVSWKLLRQEPITHLSQDGG